MISALLLGMIGPWQIVLIVLVVLLMFGGKKIPELMKGLGKGISEFKKGKEILEREFKERTDDFKPKLEESKGFLKEGLKQLGLAFKALFGKKKS